MSKIQSSLLSYPDRGQWDDSRYRGNISGHDIKDLTVTYHPKRFKLILIILL